MQSLKKTGTDFTSAQGMDPKAFFQVMGMFYIFCINFFFFDPRFTGLDDVVSLDTRAGGNAFEVV